LTAPGGPPHAKRCARSMSARARLRQSTGRQPKPWRLCAAARNACVRCRARQARSCAAPVVRFLRPRSAPATPHGRPSATNHCGHRVTSSRDGPTLRDRDPDHMPMCRLHRTIEVVSPGSTWENSGARPSSRGDRRRASSAHSAFFRLRLPAGAAAVNAIATGSQHKTMSAIGDRIARSESVSAPSSAD
jgi:hypothetical protein